MKISIPMIIGVGGHSKKIGPVGISAGTKIGIKSASVVTLKTKKKIIEPPRFIPITSGAFCKCGISFFKTTGGV
jgi:hypothetical protein